jgi:hypothetical protein
MSIYINKNGQQSGPFEDSVVIDQLRSGSLSPNDMAIRQGDASWQRVGDMFPGVSAGPSSALPIGASVAAPVASVAPAAKKGGCLKAGLIGTGLILLLLGIAVGAGSRFIPSTSCDLAKSDEERIDKLERDIEKAKSDFKYDRIGPLAIELEEATTGYEVSKKYCDDDKFRDNMIGIAGAVLAVLGALMAVVGLFVGRGK